MSLNPKIAEAFTQVAEDIKKLASRSGDGQSGGSNFVSLTSVGTGVVDEIGLPSSSVPATPPASKKVIKITGDAYLTDVIDCHPVDGAQSRLFDRLKHIGFSLESHAVDVLLIDFYLAAPEPVTITLGHTRGSSIVSHVVGTAGVAWTLHKFRLIIGDTQLRLLLSADVKKPFYLASPVVRLGG